MRTLGAALTLPDYLDGPCPLTPAQLRYVRHLSEGRSFAGIARLERVSYSTVRNQLDLARERAGVPTNLALVAEAVRGRWL